jgi:cytochrome c biogenesis protein CcdA
LIAAGVFLALAASSYWLGRVAFTPSSDTETTQAILGDEEIRSEIAALVAGADAPVLNQSPAQLKEYIEQIATIPAGAAVMADFVGEAHARLIGERDDPVRISGPQQVLIVRDELVALQQPVTLPVQEVGSVALVNSAVGWISTISAILGALSLVVGMILRPERGEFTLALGIGLASLGVSMIVLGYLVPFALLPAFSGTTWTGVFSRLANHWRTVTFGIGLIAIVLAGLVMFGTTSLRQRRQWSTPLAVGRYREDRSWSR